MLNPLNLSGSVIFTQWSGEYGLEQFIKDKTGCKPYSGAGINCRGENKTTILKSVDDTYYYNDDMSDIKYPKYTLFGHEGNQDEFEKRFNEPLLNPEKTENIYLYRVILNQKQKYYIWYGKYKIIGKEIQDHIDINYQNRDIIVLNLERV